MKWNRKLGHINMQHVQWLCRKGYLDSHGEKWGSSKVEIPRCSSCLLGKKKRCTTPGTKLSKVNEVSLKKNMLKPGDLVFSDQYDSHLEGRVFTYKGSSLKHEVYRGGTIFCDAASGFVSIHHQQTFTSDETILSKMKFEREAMGLGVETRRYCTDNGVYTSRDFLKQITSENQTIRHSGVGGDHHNGVSEVSIGNTVR